MKRFLIFLFFVTWMFAGSDASAQQNKIVFINPGHQNENSTGHFWFDVSRFMQAAANDLDIELITLFANRDHLLMRQLAQQVYQYKPTAVIIVNEKGIGISLVKQIAKQQIPIFTLLNGFTKQELARLNKQQKDLLIGSLVPNNYIAGKALMADLYQLHQQKVNTTEPYELLVLRGDYTSSASIQREQGVAVHLAANPKLHLIDSPVANWSKLEAYKKVKGILQRNHIDIIWAANDPMAYGASRAVKESGLAEKITIGGINWDQVNSDYPIDVSYGGHVILAAKALVMLHDHQTGIIPSCRMNKKQDVFSRNIGNNLKRFRNNTQGQKLEQFDFSRFSLTSPQPAKFELATFITNTYTQETSPNLACQNN